MPHFFNRLLWLALPGDDFVAESVSGEDTDSAAKKKKSGPDFRRIEERQGFHLQRRFGSPQIMQNERFEASTAKNLHT